MQDNKKAPEFKVHTPNLLNDIIANINPDGPGAIRVPLNIFSGLLRKVAIRCSQLNDPMLNKLMCQLTLYEICDPSSPGYDKRIVKQLTEYKKQNIPIKS